jgi:flavin-dependent dehydrogenase
MLGETRYVSMLCPHPIGNVAVHAAASQVFDTAAPNSIVPVGDAAAAHDPLSSYGIWGGLRSGIFAAYSIADTFRSIPGSIEKYRQFLTDDWSIYRKSWQGYYDLETRWPRAPFWARRQSNTAKQLQLA